jgi:iron complex outermembrane recepter protein
MKTFLLMFLGVMCMTTTFYAQNNVSGVLIDSLTEESLAGVRVSFPELEKGTLTDTKGYFEFQNLPNGTFIIQAGLQEYKTIISKVTLAEGQSLKLRIKLTPMVVESHGIIISGAFPTEQDNNPVEVIQLEKTDLLKTGEPTLMGALSTRPGIAQVSTGANIGKPVIRGLSGNRVLVYTQGIRLENQQWGDEHGLGVSDVGIGKVEIIKGPSSLLYGPDAMGGVIHILEEGPADIGTVQGDAGLSVYSNTIGASGDAGIKGSGKIFRGGIRVGYRNHADYQTGSAYRVSFTRFNEQVLKANVGFNLPWIVSSVRYNYTGTNVGIPEELEPSETARGTADIPHQALANQLITWQNLLLLGKHKIKVNIGYMRNRRVEFEHEHSADTTMSEEIISEGINMDLTTASYDLKWELPAPGKFHLTTGLQGMFQQNKNRGEELLIPDSRVMDAGLMSVARWDLSKLQLQGGLRLDTRRIETPEMGIVDSAGYFSPLTRTFASVNGAAGFVYKASEKFLIRFNAATGFRSPNLAELHSNGEHHGTSRYEIGDLNLGQERNFEGDLGAHFHSDHLTLDLSLFNNYIRDYIYLSPLDSVIEGLDAFAYLQGDANLNGGEISIDLHPHPLDWLHLELTGMLVNGRLMDGGNLPLIPPVRLTANLRGEFKSFAFMRDVWVMAGVVNVLAQNAVAIAEEETLGYFLLNLGAGGKVGNKINAPEIILTVNNILNESYFDHLSRLRRDNIFNIGRNISFTVRVPFTIKKMGV